MKEARAGGAIAGVSPMGGRRAGKVYSDPGFVGAEAGKISIASPYEKNL
jgi:hypothetical protein